MRLSYRVLVLPLSTSSKCGKQSKSNLGKLLRVLFAGILFSLPKPRTIFLLPLYYLVFYWWNTWLRRRTVAQWERSWCGLLGPPASFSRRGFLHMVLPEISRLGFREMTYYTLEPCCQYQNLQLLAGESLPRPGSLSGPFADAQAACPARARSEKSLLLLGWFSQSQNK